MNRRLVSLIGFALLVSLFGAGAHAATGADGKAPTTAAWVLPEGRFGPIPFRNTIREALPAFLKPHAQNVTEIWPGAAYIRNTHEIAQANGGHMAVNMGAVVYANLDTLTYQARNKAPAEKAEQAMPGDGTPDEHGILKTMHGYNGYVYRDARWGFGPDLLVTWTFYGSGPHYNPIGYYDVAKEFGGGDTFYKGARNRYFYTVGGYGVAVAVDFMKGFFFGDKVVSPYQTNADGSLAERFAFVKGDGSPPDTSWQNPVDQYGSTCLTVVEDRKLLVGVTKTPYLRILDLDPKSATFNKLATVAIDPPADLSQAEYGAMEPDRAGFTWLAGKGIVGLHKLSTGETIGLQIRLGTRPMVDRATMKIVFRKVPSLVNGVFGSHVAVPDRGITFLNVGPDTPPLQFNWPKL